MQKIVSKEFMRKYCNNAIFHWVFFSFLNKEFLMNIEENMKIIKIAIKNGG